MEQKHYLKLHKEKQYTDSQLYIDSISLLTQTNEYVINGSKDFKIEFGHDLVKEITNMSINFALSYKSKTIEEKLKYAEKSIENLNAIIIRAQIIMDTQVLPGKQVAVLLKMLGNINIQLEGWYHSLINKNNGITATE